MERVVYIHQHSGKATIFLRGGKEITFYQRLYSTTNPDEIAGLDAHIHYGKAFQRIQTKDDLERVREASTTYVKGPATTVGRMPDRIDEILPPKPERPEGPETITVNPKKRGFRG
jgi:hypothetical protein